MLLVTSLQLVEMTMVSSILPGTQEIIVMGVGLQKVTKDSILVVEMSGGITTEWEPWTILLPIMIDGQIGQHIKLCQKMWLSHTLTETLSPVTGKCVTIIGAEIMEMIVMLME